MMKKWLPWILLIALVSIGAVSTYQFGYTGAAIEALLDIINTSQLVDSDHDGSLADESPTFLGATVTTFTINGVTWVVQADCSTITSGLCIDSSDNQPY